MLKLELPQPKRQACIINTTWSNLNKEDQKIFNEAINNPDWPASTLSKQLADNGIMISESPIRKHRRGECACSKI